MATPTVPSVVGGHELLADIGGLPLTFELSTTALLALLLLVAIFWAALSVVLIYHWRKFPYEAATFRRVERWYVFGSAVFFVAALAGTVLA